MLLQSAEAVREAEDAVAIQLRVSGLVVRAVVEVLDAVDCYWHQIFQIIFLSTLLRAARTVGLVEITLPA
jgi:hypothetical protein